MSVSLTYRRDIDGLRAVAVLVVVFHHMGLGWFGGGFIGVDIFFVISGFLIGGLLMSELNETGRIDFRHFYERRIRRILPALLSVVLVTCLGSYLLLSPDDLLRVAQSVPGALLFFANHHFWSATNYFVAQSSANPLLHTWSLAVEEQFYIALPLLLILTAAHRYARAILWWGILPASLVTSQWLLSTDPTAAFYLLPSRLWELLLGVIIAVAPRLEMNRYAATVLSLVAAGAIAAAVVFISDTVPFPGVVALAPCVAAAWLIYIGHSPTPLHRLLAFKPVRGIGLISYSLYLWHWPILQFFKYLSKAPLNTTQLVAYVAVCLLLSVVSWKWIETPFRKRGVHTFRAMLLLLVSLTMLCLCFAYYAIHTKGIPSRFPESRPQAERGITLDRFPCNLTGKIRFEEIPEMCFEFSDTKLNVLLWGDSHAGHYYHGLAGLAKQLPMAITQITPSSCPPFYKASTPGTPFCIDNNDKVIDLVNRGVFDVVILSGMWGTYMSLTGEHDTPVIELLDHLHVPNTQLIFIGPGIGFDRNLLEATAPRTTTFAFLQHLLFNPEDLTIHTNTGLFLTDKRLRSHVTRPGLEYISVLDTMCRGQHCDHLTPEGDLLVWDTNHLTTKGSMLVVSKAIAPTLERLWDRKQRALSRNRDGLRRSIDDARNADR